MEIVIPNLVHQDVGYVNSTPATLIASGVPEAVVLAAVKPILRKAVDAMAEAARLAVLTPGVGQSMEYSEARWEAAEVLAAAAAGKAFAADSYPMLSASLGLDLDPQTGALATDVVGVARGIVAASDGWLKLGSEIRRTRLTIKAAIDAAGTFAEAAAAVAATQFPAA